MTVKSISKTFHLLSSDLYKIPRHFQHFFVLLTNQHFHVASTYHQCSWALTEPQDVGTSKAALARLSNCFPDHEREKRLDFFSSTVVLGDLIIFPQKSCWARRSTAAGGGATVRDFCNFVVNGMLFRHHSQAQSGPEG